MITFCLTSCNRPELLRRTLDSFFKFNTAKIERYIIVDDSGFINCLNEIQKDYPQIEIYYNAQRIGMMRSIDVLYSKVKTPYIFHCEDDWEFYRSGFIEKSKIILSQSDILQVWLRERGDTNGHPVEDLVHKFTSIKQGEVEYSYVKTGHGQWHGYSTNPGLRRLKDVVNFGKLIEGAEGHGEERVSEYYFKQGFRSVLLEPGYVRHIGEGQSCGYL
jgi:hypothetical protein